MMKHKIQCPHCEGLGVMDTLPDATCPCGWCHGFGMMIEAVRVCTHCLPAETDCLVCGGTHQRKVLYAPHSRFELDLLPDENLKEME